MAIDSKNLLVWVKAMSRGQALPLDASEIYATYAEAENYASTSAIAYAGQTVKAMTEDGKYHEYLLQPSEAGYTLEEVGAIKASDLKQYVQVVEALPESAQEQGVLYICGAVGSIWTGTEWKQVFYDVSVDFAAANKRIDDLSAVVDTKAPIENPVFSGVVKVGEDEVALKPYVESLFAQLEESHVPGLVDSENALPAADYKAGMAYRVAEAGEYAGAHCEPGDLILVVRDYVEGSASDEDFMVIQANIDGAVTSSSDATTVGEIVVFDAVTGRVVKGSGVQIASLNDAIAKAHEHVNKEALDTYDVTKEQLLQAAQTTAQGLVDAHAQAVNSALEGKADKATTLAGYGITDAYTKEIVDQKLGVITENLNTKAAASDVATAIATAKSEAIAEAGTAADEALALRVGEIPEDTNIKSYIDNAVGAGGTASATAIAEAKAEAIAASKEYTDSEINTLKGYVNTQDAATLGSAKTYAEEQAAAAVTAANSYADAQDANVLSSAKSYTDTQIIAALTVAEF